MHEALGYDYEMYSDMHRHRRWRVDKACSRAVPWLRDSLSFCDCINVLMTGLL